MSFSTRSPALGGQLQVFSLNTVLSALNLQKVTGLLTLASLDQTAQVAVAQGEIVDAWSSTGERGLGALLPLFGWENGFFSFEVRMVETQTINISLPVLQVRAAVWLEEQKATRQRSTIFTREVPSPDHLMVVNPNIDGDIELQPDQLQVLMQLFAAPRTVREVAEALGESVETFVPKATQLVRNNLVRIQSPVR